MEEYATDWKNVDLTRPANLRLNILDPYDFGTLLLEIETNLPEINESTVRAQFEHELNLKTRLARQIFNDNLKNIVATAKVERAQD